MPQYTPNQLQAIDISRLGQDACIVAGPGSGKTTVLVERYRQLVESGINPREILAITFTEKAAANMKDKMAKAFSAHSDLRRQIEGAYISTVHGFCQRLLKENAIAAGVDPQFAVLDDRQGQIRRGRCAVDALDTSLHERRADTERLIAAIDQPDLAVPLVEIYEALRGAGAPIDRPYLQDPPDPGAELAVISDAIERYRRFTGSMTARRFEYRDQLIDWASTARAAYSEGNLAKLVALAAGIRILPGSVDPNWKPAFEELKEHHERLLDSAVVELYAAERGILVDVLVRFDRLYSQEKQRLGVLDFSDLEHFVIRLLENNPGVRARVQTQFRQILMDEYQDTNGQQARLLRLLRAAGNFYAVGDINQSIFGFRYASPEVFREHRDVVEATGQQHVELVENFRSRADILYAVETLLDNAIGVESRQLVARRELPAKQHPSVEITAAFGDTKENAWRAEAEWIASRMLELRASLTIGQDSRPADFRDMAVLVRKSSLLGPLTEAFERFGVAYQVTRQIGFFESREIRDLTNLLRAISNPRDEVSLAVVLRSPLAGLSDEALLRLKSAAGNLGAVFGGPVDGDSAGDAAGGGLDSLDRERWIRFRQNFDRWRAAVHHIPTDRLLVRAMADCGYTWTPGSAAGDNIEKLLALARNAPRDQSLAEFVHEIHLIREEDAREADAPFDEALNAVRVITAHASKGLEFPVVFIPRMETGMSANRSPLSFTTEGGLGAKWRNPDGGKPLSDWFRTANKRAIDRRENEESNRLLYVAMTRAEEHLVLSYALGPDDKPKNWASHVARVFAMDAVERDGPVQLIRAGDAGREFDAAVRTITRTPAALPIDGRAAFAASVDEVARPPITGQEDSSATVTSLTLFADCPRRYYLARYLGWEAKPPRTLGSSVEIAMDETVAPLPSSELGKTVHALLASQPVESPDFQALHLADTFERSDLGRRARKAQRVEREFDFIFAIEDMVVSGQIDLWFEDRAGHVIVDYKTDDVARSDVASRTAAYQLQLRFYALAIEKFTGALPAEAWLYFLRPDVAVRVDLARAALEDARRLVSDLASSQRGAGFPLNEGTHCFRCPFYRNKCPSRA